MSKQRKKRPKKHRSNPKPGQQPTVIHRYSAETEEKTAKRKRLKVKGVAGAIALVLALLIGWLINWLIF